jgi:hypothetical protein
MSGNACGDRKQAQPQPFRLPPPSVVFVESKHLQPRGQLEGESDDREPDPVLVESVQRKILQAGVFRDADAVFAAGAATMP